MSPQAREAQGQADPSRPAGRTLERYRISVIDRITKAVHIYIYFSREKLSIVWWIQLRSQDQESTSNLVYQGIFQYRSACSWD
jgi:hypothetical protein